MNDYIQQVSTSRPTRASRSSVEKMVAFFTSRDRAITETLSAGAARRALPGFAEALERHESAWTELWDVVRRSAAVRAARRSSLLRFHIAHILQVCSRLHRPARDAGVPARGLNGEAYRGHVFWDELYVYPFLDFRLPEITRGLLMYRYRRLAEARAAAAEAGYAARCIPWQTGSDGTEETQVVHLNPLSGQWDPDHSHNQRHVNAAIFYNVWQYYQATDDLEFLRDYGAELMLEIARFWASIAHRNPQTGTLRDPRRDGSRRVPRAVPRRHRGRAAQQRLHERDGRLDRVRRRREVLDMLPASRRGRCGPGSGSPTPRSSAGTR